MAPPPSARRPAANRGGLSARQFADIRQAARIARSERVVLVMHGVKVSRDDRGAGRQQNLDQTQRVQDAGDAEPMDTDGNADAVTASKKKKDERSALRRAQHVPRRCAERWATFVARAMWAARRQRLDATFTAHMRSRMSPQRDAHRKLHRLGWRAWARHCRLQWRLRCLLWRSWTHRCQDVPSSSTLPTGLGKISRRDAYIHDRAQRLVPQLIQHGLIAGTSDADPADEDAELQEAIRLSLADSNARSPGGRTASTRSLDEAGIPATPGSARARKKRSGRKS